MQQPPRLDVDRPGPSAQVRLYGHQNGKSYLNETIREDLHDVRDSWAGGGLLTPKPGLRSTPRGTSTCDNLLIGYKGFFDGLGPERQTEGRIHPGAQLIADDSHISRWTIEVHKGPERSVITISPLENTATVAVASHMRPF